ncbi:hypothetical protein [Desulfofundulus thermocisternus]|uniref:hypothetical protein n=1 Tax=Desulfofundulus thermocisternus TaxID=42471 RepID=UPI00217E2F3F|nr:hypothetical protein [Desulfofundulus thermocisternus]MCS5694553.1 hypothetical protein [Desulfofundulus thermocisternus]
MDDNDDRQVAGSDTPGERSEPGKEKRVTGKIIAVLLGLLVCALIAWQGMSSLMFNQKVELLGRHFQSIQKKFDQLGSDQDVTLVQLIEQINNLKKEIEKLMAEYQDLSYQYRFTLSLLKNTSLQNKLEANSKELQDLLEICEKLMSLVQRSEQIDKDLAAFSDSMTWKTILDKMDSIIAENREIKSELVKLVVPEQLEFYQKTFVKALNEKELYLVALNDFLYSSFNANIKAELAISTYENAYFYWEIEQAISYANEARELLGQAENQLAEAAVHWKRYKELKEKIKEADSDEELKDVNVNFL